MTVSYPTTSRWLKSRCKYLVLRGFLSALPGWWAQDILQDVGRWSASCGQNEKHALETLFQRPFSLLGPKSRQKSRCINIFLELMGIQLLKVPHVAGKGWESVRCDRLPVVFSEGSCCLMMQEKHFLPCILPQIQWFEPYQPPQNKPGQSFSQMTQDYSAVWSEQQSFPKIIPQLAQGVAQPWEWTLVLLLFPSLCPLPPSLSVPV